jgi:hypothetical protein
VDRVPQSPTATYLSRFSGDGARVGCHSLGRDLTAQDDFNAETSIESRSVSQVGIFWKEAGRGESQDEESLHLAKIPLRNCKNCRPTCFHQVVLKVKLWGNIKAA